MSEQNNATIGALLRERQACEERGLDDRVKAINFSLRKLGVKAKKPDEQAETRLAPQTNVEQR